MRGAPHFQPREFFSVSGKRPPKAWMKDAHDLAVDYLEPLRAEFGRTVITSGWRDPTHNARVGGAPRSFHLRYAGRGGAAVDLVCEKGSPADWYAFLDKLGPGGLGLYSGHVHVDNRRGARARWTG